MITTAKLIWSIVIATVAILAASGLALLLMPRLSLEAAIRGGTIALFSMIAVRVGIWWSLRRKHRSD